MARHDRLSSLPNLATLVELAQQGAFSVVNARSIGGIGLLYQVDAQAEDALSPESHQQSQPTGGDKFAMHASGLAQDWAAQASLIGSVYYSFVTETDGEKAAYALPRGTLVPFGKEVQLRLDTPCYYLQLEDGRVFCIALQRKHPQGPAPFVFVARKQVG